MTCASCLAIPFIILGITITPRMLIAGLLLTVLSLSSYLHYKEFKDCKECNEDKCPV
jgi:hypothetical protein|uniref:Uncharacterized protein n=1 Tax=viral metagenome TaxID=1070528 RepID=A0A6C0KCX1_9ZZZZ